eukprot:TRINITY_DN97019_c0_g1_i1.p1 TRINITY_DN97019_c0_g1~~TRINITY_DN97019_c0_g1_i1.p1  ORF type:complete len:125 (-),score=2.61 TRINITY_DN97019_c0_g1_i1:4-378(-)
MPPTLLAALSVVDIFTPVGLVSGLCLSEGWRLWHERPSAFLKGRCITGWSEDVRVCSDVKFAAGQTRPCAGSIFYGQHIRPSSTAAFGNLSLPQDMHTPSITTPWHPWASLNYSQVESATIPIP